MINFIIVLCIALVVMAFVEWLKKPFPNAPSWVWWAVTPVAAILLGILLEGLSGMGVFIGLVGFAFATLFYDYIIQWAKAKIDALKQ